MCSEDRRASSEHARVVADLERTADIGPRVRVSKQYHILVGECFS